MVFSLSSKSLIAAIAATTLLGTPAISKATTTTSSATITTQTPPGSFSPALTQFDPSLGTLTAATVSLTLNLHPGELELNEGSPGTSFTVTLKNLTFTIDDPYSGTSSQFSDFTGNPAYSASGTAGTFFSTQNFSSPDVPFSSSTNVPTGNLADYIGNGTVSPLFNDSAIGTSAITGAGQFASFSLSFDGTETVTYTYTPNATPEPASLSLLALSGAGLLLRRRRQS